MAQSKDDDNIEVKKTIKIRRETDNENGSKSATNGSDFGLSVPSKKIVDELFKDFISNPSASVESTSIKPPASNKSLDEMYALLDREISLISTKKSDSPKAEDVIEKDAESLDNSAKNLKSDEQEAEESEHNLMQEPSVEEGTESRNSHRDKSRKKHKKDKHKSKKKHYKGEDSPKHSSRKKNKEEGSKHSSRKKHGDKEESTIHSSEPKDSREEESDSRPSRKITVEYEFRERSRVRDDIIEQKTQSYTVNDDSEKIKSDERLSGSTVKDEKRSVSEEKSDSRINFEKISKQRDNKSDEIFDDSSQRNSEEVKGRSSHKKHKRDRDGSLDSETSSRKKHKKKHKHESSEDRKIRREEKKRKKERDRDYPTFEDIHDHLDKHEDSMETEHSVVNRDSHHDSERHSKQYEREKKDDSRSKLDAFDKMKLIFEKVKREKSRLKDSENADKKQSDFNLEKSVEKVRITNQDLKTIVDKKQCTSEFIDDDVIILDKVEEGRSAKPILIDDDVDSAIEASSIPLPVPAPENIPLPDILPTSAIPLPVSQPKFIPAPETIPLPSTTPVLPPAVQDIPPPPLMAPMNIPVPPPESNTPPLRSTPSILPPTPLSVPPPPSVTIPLPAAQSSSVSDSFELTSIPLPVPKPKPVTVKLGLNLKTDIAEFIASGEKIDKKGKRREEGEVTSESDDYSSNDDSDGDDDDDGDEQITGNGSVSETGSLPDSDDDETSKKKKKKRKHKKKKKHKTKEKESDKEKCKIKKDSKSRDESRERSKDRKRSKRDKSRSRSRSRSEGRSRRKSNEVFDRGWDAYSYAQDLIATTSHGKMSRERYRRSRSRSRSRRSTSRSRGRRSRSRSRSRSKYSKSKRSRSRSRSKRSRSRSRRSSSKSRSRRSSSKSRPRKNEDKTEDLRLHIDKKKLRKIAIANALANLKSGNMNSADLASLKSGGKSVEELTEYCKALAGKERGQFSSSDSDSPLNTDDEKDQPFINHPFIVREAAPIIMNIRNSKQLPIMSATDKNVGILRSQFPVSSGNQHRLKELEWVPVEKTTATVAMTTTTTTEAQITATDTATTSEPTASGSTPAVSSVIVDPVFPKPVSMPIDIGAIVSERLQAVRKLQENPYDVQALNRMHKSQEKASQWATSQYQPGTFTGSTGVQILSKQELEGTNKHNKAWIKKVGQHPGFSFCLVR